MTDYFISCEGNDSASGTSEAEAWRNVTKIQQRDFAPGDRIQLRRGDSWANAWALALRCGGAEGAPITLDCYGNPEAPYPELRMTEWGGFSVLQLDKPWLAVRHLNVMSARNGIVISNAPACDVREIVAKGCGGHGIQLSRIHGPSPSVKIETCQAIECGGMGISLTTEQDLICSYNLARRCCLDTDAPADNYDLNYTAGIKIFGMYGCSGVILEHNTCEDCGNSVQTDQGIPHISKGMGLWVDTVDPGSVAVRSNVLRDNLNSGIMIELSQRIDVYNNRAYRNGGNTSTVPNKAGIVLHRGAVACRVKCNTCFENPYQTLVTGYSGMGAEGIDQISRDNVFEENTLLGLPDHLQNFYACMAPCDPAEQLRVNECEEWI
jgi:hypothetical protein